MTQKTRQPLGVSLLRHFTESQPAHLASAPRPEQSPSQSPSIRGKIQDQDRARVPLAARERKDCRQKIQKKSEAENRGKNNAKRCMVSPPADAQFITAI